ncbi:siroheme synthase [Daedalea quercina L-15889]|uniref:precorrin-2 dehydrogenase n=1 Tax=Daedalea quercina L-15889 TaxID=1314783 RepID=A0A165U0H8_9APHY|nr:siroheme synthase [Daedalea quercina L-15889]
MGTSRQWTSLAKFIDTPRMADTASLSGGSLLLAWQLKDKTVLIIGGGDVASGRIESVLVADARVTLIAPSAGLHPLTKQFIEDYPDRITYHDRTFAGPSDLAGVDMVLTAIDDVDKSREICALAREHRIPINVADIPPSCDFYFGSQIRSGPLQIMISTNGQSPKLANLIRKQIERSIPDGAGEAVEKVGVLRSKLRERAPGVGGELGKRRMRWMIDVCTNWEMEDLALLDEDMMAKLLDDGWEKNRVPRLQEVGGAKRRSSTSTPKTANLWLSSAAAFVVGAACTVAVLLTGRR